mgnify:CR=1 FL=1
MASRSARISERSLNDTVLLEADLFSKVLLWLLSPVPPFPVASQKHNCDLPQALVVGLGIRVKYVDNEYSDDDDDDDDDEDEFEDATIQKVNEDETFDIVFDEDDDETRKNVPFYEIQIQNVSGV